jgi:hypothetical protein
MLKFCFCLDGDSEAPSLELHNLASAKWAALQFARQMHFGKELSGP